MSPAGLNVLKRTGTYVNLNSHWKTQPSCPGSMNLNWTGKGLMKDGIRRELAGQFGLRFRIPHKSQGSFTCRKSATLDRLLYFPSEGMLWIFFVRKIRRLLPGSNPRPWVPEASILISRPPKPLSKRNMEHIQLVNPRTYAMWPDLFTCPVYFLGS
jgi:hypothetical protein